VRIINAPLFIRWLGRAIPWFPFQDFDDTMIHLRSADELFRCRINRILWGCCLDWCLWWYDDVGGKCCLLDVLLQITQKKNMIEEKKRCLKKSESQPANKIYNDDDHEEEEEELTTPACMQSLHGRSIFDDDWWSLSLSSPVRVFTLSTWLLCSIRSCFLEWFVLFLGLLEVQRFHPMFWSSCSCLSIPTNVGVPSRWILWFIFLVWGVEMMDFKWFGLVGAPSTRRFWWCYSVGACFLPFRSSRPLLSRFFWRFFWSTMVLYH